MAEKSIKFTPGRGKLLVKISPVEEKTKGGLYLSAGSQDQKSDEGEVIAVGPERINSNGTFVAATYKIGDKVKFDKYNAQEIVLNDNEKNLIVDEDIILGKFN